MSEMNDTVLGTIILTVFLASVFAVGWVLYRIKNAALARAWTTLLPLVEGAAITGDGGGAATTWLSGSYQGHKIQASSSPDVAKYPEESGHSANRFTAALLEVPGAHDFRITSAPTLGQFGRGSWRVDADDAGLQATLTAAGVIALVCAFGDLEIFYDRRERMLRFVEDVRPMRVPPPERFRQELDMLIELARIAASVNVAR